MTDNSTSRWYDFLLFGLGFPLMILFIKILFRTYRLVRVGGKEEADKALSRSGGRAVYASWHQRVFFPVRELANQNVTVMVSRSRDGEYAAKLLKGFGLKSARGSSTRGGYGALKELTRNIIGGASGGMVVDGPLGPPREAKIGAVALGRDAQVPVIPLAYGADRCWVFKSWDRFMVPKPFARIVLTYAEPIWIPEASGEEALSGYRRLLEERLNHENSQCDRHFGQERPWAKDQAGRPGSKEK
jgi:lysophospholipid acyltransferase (LPLAT)-like uncharacterized protein